jgi:hypothetical protein
VEVPLSPRPHTGRLCSREPCLIRPSRILPAIPESMAYRRSFCAVGSFSRREQEPGQSFAHERIKGGYWISFATRDSNGGQQTGPLESFECAVRNAQVTARNVRGNGCRQWLVCCGLWFHTAAILKRDCCRAGAIDAGPQLRCPGVTTTRIASRGYFTGQSSSSRRFQTVPAHGRSKGRPCRSLGVNEMLYH